jgi:Zn-dependent protease with chaperone function
MRFPEPVLPVLSRMVLPLACAAMLAAGCSTSPTSGRTQFNILPGELETTVPDLRFGAKTLLVSGGEYCREDENPCPAREAAEKLAQRIAPIAERLGTTAAQLSPELVSRIPQVEVFVVPGDSTSVSSSAGGRIAVGAGLARLDLTDTDLAFALAREFGRLAAAHHRESASAGLAVSLVAGSPLTSAYLATSILADIIFPMGALAKVGISLLASMGTEQLVEASQQDEADEFAAKLIMAAGYDPKALAEPRPNPPQGGLQVGWLPSFLASRGKVAALALPDPWPDEAPAPVALSTAAPDPWPDDEQVIPPQEVAAMAGAAVVSQLAVPAPETGKAVEAQMAPPKAVAAKKTQGVRQPAVKKPRKTIRKTPKKNRRR